MQVYFPSIFPHHAFSVVGDHQSRTRNTVLSPFGLINGIPNEDGTFSAVDEMQKFTLNYYLPIAYPDANISFLSYIQRIKLNPFFTYYHSQFRALSSWGLTVSADMNLLRYWYLFDIGIKSEFIPQYNKSFFSMTLGVSF